MEPIVKWLSLGPAFFHFPPSSPPQKKKFKKNWIGQRVLQTLFFWQVLRSLRVVATFLQSVCAQVTSRIRVNFKGVRPSNPPITKNIQFTFVYTRLSCTRACVLLPLLWQGVVYLIQIERILFAFVRKSSRKVRCPHSLHELSRSTRKLRKQGTHVWLALIHCHKSKIKSTNVSARSWPNESINRCDNNCVFKHIRF